MAAKRASVDLLDSSVAEGEFFALDHQSKFLILRKLTALLHILSV
jgi:hypothetical protein